MPGASNQSAFRIPLSFVTDSSLVSSTAFCHGTILPLHHSLFHVTVLLVIGTLLYTHGSRVGSSSIHDFVLVKVNCRNISMGHAKTATSVWSS
jgi:hypothetical protein